MNAIFLLAQAAPSGPSIAALVVGLAAAILVAHAIGIVIWIGKKLRSSGHDQAADFVDEDLRPVVEFFVEAYQRMHGGDATHPSQQHLLDLAAAKPGMLDRPDVIRALDGPPAKP